MLPRRKFYALGIVCSAPLLLNAQTTSAPPPTLRPGQQLTLLTDGVVEARDADGKLFGFGRTAALSTQPAEEIARAAQQFGQEDDITVLTLSFTAKEVCHA